jgi:hypothetical protein
MTQEPSIGNLAEISIFDSMAAGGAHAGESAIMNKLKHRGGRVCAKGDTSIVWLSRPMWGLLSPSAWRAVSAGVTAHLFPFQTVFRQMANTDLPREKAKTRSMNRDIGTK